MPRLGDQLLKPLHLKTLNSSPVQLKSFKSEETRGSFSYSNKVVPELILQSNKKTFMIKNIPNKYTKNMLLNEIKIGFADLFDFFYLQIDPKTLCNMGYAFINFKSFEAA